jgi:hypothetical protein
MLGDRAGTELQRLQKPKNSCEKPKVSELYITISELKLNDDA